jgi:hypothetical protein
VCCGKILALLFCEESAVYRAKPNVLKCAVGFCLLSARLKFALSVRVAFN